MKIITEEACAGFARHGHPERPARITSTLQRLRAQSELPVAWARPGPADEDALHRAHTANHIARLRVPEDFDGDTPYHAHIADYARRSVGAALGALTSARAGETVFSLMRPPGHHATKNRAMGFCYLNNLAIAVLEALATGAKRVAVYDFDVHHGNGTEDILLDKPGAAFFSIHQYPCYPGTGTAHRGENCFNYPVAPYTPRAAYRKTLQSELDALKMAYNAIQQGAAGVDMGRNIFQSDAPIAMIQAVRKVVHENMKPQDALEFYRALKAKDGR
jgi:acetoin utilization deacetylase AcuC-like enzyme